MPGRFYTKPFSEIDLSDPIFDELKADYPGTASSSGFINWFANKSQSRETASVFEDDDGLGAFVYTKFENEPISLSEGALPERNRLKIGTFKMAEAHRGQRLGEGALGLALWEWQASNCQEIYVTVFPKHKELTDLLTRFGFKVVGKNADGEDIYLRSKAEIDYGTPYASYPFINPTFKHGRLMVVEDQYHDTLFPHSELAHTVQDGLQLAASNGVSKVYVGTPIGVPPYKPGEPILIYRKHTGQGRAGYKSCVTSFGIVTNVVAAKQRGKALMPLDEVLAKVGNKSVFDANEISEKYDQSKNLVIIELVYCGYFGKGNNLNWVWLKNNGLWPDTYPTNARYTPEEFLRIINEGGINVQNALIN